MIRRDDPVFQLSLTELAFTIAFLLLLLLGLRIAQTGAERDAALRVLAHAGEARDAAANLQQARGAFERTLREAGAADPDALLSKLVAAQDVRAERDSLRARVAELDAKLSALQAVAGHQKPLKPELGGVEALADSQPVAGAGTGGAGSMPGFGSYDEGQPGSGPGTGSGSGSGKARGPATSPRSGAGSELTAASAAERDTDNLRGQVAYLSRRLASVGGATGGHGGRDYPPCWADAEGRVELLFDIELRPGAIAVKASWAPAREAEARALPGVEELLARTWTPDEFVQRVQPLYAWSRGRTPECRHYVQLRSAISDAVQSDRARLLVERFFYKIEVPR
ncbi:MAG TPA: hypothetical protein VH328_01080 [Burkholderiaceae bacterium]|nr:hypothetical protein [Burkholderiaceae bacterium]